MTPTNPSPAQRTTRIIAIALALAALLIVTLILLVSGGQQEEQRPPTAADAHPVTPSPTGSVTPTAVVALNAAPATPSPLPLPTPAISETNIVARVNGQIIISDAAAVIRLADMAAARLLGQALPPDESGLLDRLINGELVAQAAQSAGFQLSTTDVDIALQSWLAGLDKTHAELEHELDAVGLDLPGFRAYFAQLLTVDRFATLAAHNAGVDVADYLRTLQSSAQVSLGPAAADLYQATAAVGNVTQEAAGDAPGDVTEGTTTAQTPAAQTSPFNWGVLAGQPAAMTPLSATAGFETDEVRSPEVGRLAPLFDLALLGDAPTARLTLADLAGKPSVLSFWTTWCPYCRQQTPVLVAARQNDVDSRFNWVGVNVQEDANTVGTYVTDHGMNYAIALDADGAAAGSYAVNGYPITYFLDADTRIVARHVGALTAETIAGYLQQLANGG